MVMSPEDWNKELLENMKKTALILEAVQNLEERIKAVEAKLDSILNVNGVQNVSIGKVEGLISKHEEEIDDLHDTVKKLTAKVYTIVGAFSAIITAIQILLKIFVK